MKRICARVAAMLTASLLFFTEAGSVYAWAAEDVVSENEIEKDSTASEEETEEKSVAPEEMTEEENAVPEAEAEEENLTVEEGNEEVSEEPLKAVSGDYEYNLDAGGAVITKYNGNAASVAIPDKLDGNDVIEIGDYAFAEKAGLTAVSFPASLRKIGPDSFRATGLTSVTIPSGVIALGSGAFKNCTALRTLKIESEKLDSIGYGGISYVFDGCTFSNVSFPAGMTKIPNYLFAETGFTSDSNVKTMLPSGLVEIGDGVFSNCVGIKAIDLPADLTKIGADAFRGIEELTAITIPSKVTAIGSGAFKNDTGLKTLKIESTKLDNIGFGGIAYVFDGCTFDSVSFPSGMTKIPDAMFAEAGFSSSSNVKTMLPSGLEEIGDYAFYKAVGIKAIDLPAGLTKIGADAFCDVKELESITLPAKVNALGSGAFKDCSGLKTLKIDCVKLDKVGFGGISNVFAGCTFDSVIISTNLKTIPDYFFASCGFSATANTKNMLPATIKEIGNNAFYETSGLKEIILPEDLETIGEEAFRGLDSLSYVSFPVGIKKIKKNAFRDCAPENVIYQGKEAAWKKVEIEDGNDGIKNPTKYEGHEGKMGDREVSEGDVIVPAVPTTVIVETETNVSDNPVKLKITYKYENAVTYTGKTIDPEKDLKMQVDISSVTSQITVLQGYTINDVLKLSYVQKNAKNANSNKKKKSTVYAKIKVLKTAKKALSKEDLAKLKKLVKAANKELKAKKCEYTINPLSVTKCAPEVHAKLAKDGKIKAKNGKLKGLKKVMITMPGAEKSIKATKSMCGVSEASVNDGTVRVTGKKNFTGSKVVKVVE